MRTSISATCSRDGRKRAPPKSSRRSRKRWPPPVEAAAALRADRPLPRRAINMIGWRITDARGSLGRLLLGAAGVAIVAAAACGGAPNRFTPVFMQEWED